MTFKKRIMCITLIILSITINSGCMSPQITSFTMLSTAVIDDDGFPSLLLHFEINDVITLKLVNSGKQVAFTNSFYSSQSETAIPLAPYRNSPQPGDYQIQVYDKNKNPIYESTFSFKETNLDIISVEEQWWKENQEYSLIGVIIAVKNNGDLPIYPYTLNLTVDDKSTSAYILPAAILPEETGFLNCSLYIDSVDAGEKNCYISVHDKNGRIMTESTFSIIPIENVPIQHINWNYNGKIRELNIPLPYFLHEYYSEQKRFDINDYAAYVLDPYDDLYLSLIRDSLLDLVGDVDDISKINLVASFVQSLDFKWDDPQNISYEYPRYPVEILDKQPCDCEDKSILAGNILMLMGYNVSLLDIPFHMAIGVHIDQNLSGYKYYIDKYYFLETTHKGKVLGDSSGTYPDIDEVTVYPLTPRLLLHQEWKKAEGILINGKLNYVKLKLVIENLGNMVANNIGITGAFYSSTNEELNQEKTSITSLQPGEKKQIYFQLIVPKDISTILKSKLYIDETMVNEKESDTRFP